MHRHGLIEKKDFTDSITSIWEQNGQFGGWISSQKVDFAIIDAEKWKATAGIHLTHQNSVIQSSGTNPLICIANYLFDSLKHDAFCVNKAGELEEWKLQISSLFSPADKRFLPSVIESSDMKWKLEYIQDQDKDRKQQEGPYLFDSNFNRILNWYQTKNTVDTPEGISFLLPTGAIRLLEELMKFSGNNLMLIAGDKAERFPHEFDSYNEPPGITSHQGCFSFTTNFDAIGKLFEMKNGFHSQATRESEFCVSCFVAAPQKRTEHIEDMICSDEQYDIIIDRAKKQRNEYSFLCSSTVSMINFGPEHYFNIYEGAKFINKQYKMINSMGKNKVSVRREVALEEYFDMLLAQLHLSNYDVDLFVLLQAAIIHSITKPNKYGNLKRILFRVWGNDYYIPEISNDTAFSIGTLFQALEELEKAIKFFEQSVDRFPKEKFASLYNIGICYQQLEKHDVSLRYFEQCYQLDADDEDVRDKLEELRNLVAHTLEESLHVQPTVYQTRSTKTIQEETIPSITVASRRSKYE